MMSLASNFCYLLLKQFRPLALQNPVRGVAMTISPVAVLNCVNRMEERNNSALLKAKAAVVKYYDWAGRLRDNKMRLGAQLLPPVLALWLIASVFGGSSGAPETQSRMIENENYSDLTTGTETPVGDRNLYPATTLTLIKNGDIS
jgi:hypothetical protein